MLLQPIEFQRYIPAYIGHKPYYIDSILAKGDVQYGFYCAVPMKLSASFKQSGRSPITIIEDERTAILAAGQLSQTGELEFTKSRPHVTAEISAGADIHQPGWYWPIVHPGYKIYGHWLIDIIPRILLCQQLSGRQVTCLLRPDTPSFATELLNLMGIAARSISSFEGDQVVYLSTVRRHDWLSTQALRLLREEICQLKHSMGAGGATNEKIYLSRRLLTSNSRAMTNQEDVEAFFRDLGFSIVHPQTMPLEEQIRMFSAAAVVAGEAGSAMHNSVWCSEDCRFLNLQSARQSHFIQSSLCHHFAQTSVTVFGRTETDNWDSPFAIDVELLEQYRGGLVNPNSLFWSPRATQEV